MRSIIQTELEQAAQVLQNFIDNPDNLAVIEKAAHVLSETLQQGGKIISCGNGGSHCDAMHFAEELSGRYRENRRPLPAVAISDPSHISCVGNDYGYEYVFSRYIEALGQAGDTLVAFSTSGNSPSILEAARVAKQKGMQVIALTGKEGGNLAHLTDIEIRVPHQGYADRIQEVHIKIIHILILLIEKQVLQN